MSQVNYIKAMYQSIPNLVFIGVMVFFSLVVSPALLLILAAGELSILMLAQTGFVKNIMRASAERQAQQQQQQMEDQIVLSLPNNYKADFQALKHLCQEIRQHAVEVEKDQTSG